jgi:biotin synthase-related radical SAM superfamily protein
MQTIVRDDNGVLRFRQNAIVRYLLDAGHIDLNDIALRRFDDEDRAQLAQLIGYSLSGFSELSYVNDETYEQAEYAAMLFEENE